MRKEVIRSLIYWPAVVSATVVGVAWLSAPDGPSTQWLLTAIESIEFESETGRSWPQRPVVFNEAELAAWPVPDESGPASLSDLEVPSVDFKVLEREQAHSLELPARLAGARKQSLESKANENEAKAKTIKAPVRNERQEIAGLILQEPRLPGLDLTPLVESLRESSEAETNDDQQVQDAREGSDDFVGPPRPEYVVIEEEIESSSILPKSVSALGNLVEPDVEAIDQDESQITLALPTELEATGEPAVDAEKEVVEDEVQSASDSLTLSQAEVEPEAVPPIPVIVETEQQTDALPEVIKAEPALPETANVVRTETPQRPEIRVGPAAWPVTNALDLSLKSLEGTAASEWAEKVSQQLTALRQLARIGAPESGQLLDELDELATQGLESAEEISDRDVQIQWLRTAFAVKRRVAVWNPIWSVASDEDPTWMVSDQDSLVSEEIDQVIASVRNDLEETGDQAAWSRYLMLDQVANMSETTEYRQRQVIAQRLLSRLQWHGLDDEHLRWLNRDSVADLAETIRPWARSAVDYAQLMQQMERRESDAIDLAAIDIAGVVQTLRFAESQKATSVATALDTYYRNANVRTAISDTLLQRFLPTVETQVKPVRERMFGSNIRGTSQIDSDLQIALSPSPDRWNICLKTLGDVRTNSTGYNGPVALRTRGQSRFVAETPIVVTRKGATIGNSVVNATGTTRLRGIRTDYDGWPLIGSLTKSYAESQYQAIAAKSNRVANRKIQKQVGDEIDTRLTQSVNESSEKLSDLVLGPLGRLQLDPKVVDMQTTESRILARYRLAGDWQLAAFTPRPRAPRSSLMSVQVHQSAINNTLEQLVPKDEPKLIQEIFSDSLVLFGSDERELPDDMPDDVSVQFAKTRPITIEVEDGSLWVTLRVMKLTRGKKLNLKRFIVRARYLPQYDGLNASLVREGHLSISGPRMSMRDRLPLRAIFNKVLSPNRPLQLTLPRLVEHPAAEGLAISQLELRDGWIALAVSEAAAPKIAIRRPADLQPSTVLR